MAETSILPPSQFSQPSRKGKKAWRKNVDLTEIQEGLEQVNAEIITGGIVKELPSDALFTTDSTGSRVIESEYARKHKPLKADQILAERSAVPALESQKRANDSPNVTDGVVSKKRRMNSVSHREYQRLRQIAYGGEAVHKDVVKADGDVAYDPWEEKISVKPKEFEFIEDERPAREPVTLKQQPISMAADGRKIRAVRKPAAEKSYNPTSEDWLRRFEREGYKEVEAERKRLEEQEKEQEKQERIARALEADENEKELESEWESEWEGIASGTEEVPEWLSKKSKERKTKAQRNRIKRRKEEDARQKHEAKEKIKRQQAERIKSISKQVNKEEEIRRQEKLQSSALVPADDSSDDGEDVELKRIQPFGKARIPDAPLEILLIEDLPDSLRTLKPEGNILSDRYRSLLLQGKVESRKSAQQKKKQPKLTEKWSYKDWKLK